jgi:hypothetical protein
LHSIRVLVLRMVRENPGRGYRRVHGELRVPGVTVAASTVREILQSRRLAGIVPCTSKKAPVLPLPPQKSRVQLPGSGVTLLYYPFFIARRAFRSQQQAFRAEEEGYRRSLTD